MRHLLALILFLCLCPSLYGGTHYETLGVSPQASPEEIEKAFTRLAREFHPDRNIGDPTAAARFREASEAYEVLGNPEKRTRYDAPPPPVPRAPAPRPAEGEVPEGTKFKAGSVRAEYRVTGLLGKGAGGEVYQVQPVAGGMSRAAKIISVPRSRSGKVPANGYDRVVTLSKGEPPDSLLGFDPISESVTLVSPAGHRSARPYRVILMELADQTLESASARPFAYAAGEKEADELLRRTEAFARDGLASITDLGKLGLAHGDLKPSNFFWVTGPEGGKWKLGDLDSVDTVGKLGNFSIVQGSPEQFAGHTTPLTDAYGLAGTTYALLFGRPPILDYLVEHEGITNLNAMARQEIHQRIRSVLTKPKSRQAFDEFIGQRLATLGSRFPSLEDRLNNVTSFIAAGLQTDSETRRQQLANVPMAVPLLREVRGIRLENSLLGRVCLIPLSRLGLYSPLRRIARP